MVQTPRKIRLPAEAYSDTDSQFHVVFHCLPDTAPFVDPALGAAMWQLITNERGRSIIELLAACLMRDDAHFLLAPKNKDVVSWVRDFEAYSSSIARGYTGRRAIWQPSFYDRRLRANEEIEVAVGYILRNPLEAGYVEDGKEWPWAEAWLEG